MRNLNICTMARLWATIGRQRVQPNPLVLALAGPERLSCVGLCCGSVFGCFVGLWFSFFLLGLGAACAPKWS